MIGVFDSGIGGLTVLKSLRQVMPNQNFLYYGDHKNAPYGTKMPAEIHEFTRQAVRFLFDQGCRLVILACNTASAVALRDLQLKWLPQQPEWPNIRVLGVFVPVIEAMTGREWGDTSPPTNAEIESILLFATEASVRSNAFERELAQRAQNINVTSIACPNLASAIEEGHLEQIETLVRRYVQQGLDRNPLPEAVALCCTHYPHAYEIFQRYLPPETPIFSQGEIVAQALLDYLKRHPEFRDDSDLGTGKIRYLTSGKPNLVSQAAQKFTGEKIIFERT